MRSDLFLSSYKYFTLSTFVFFGSVNAQVGIVVDQPECMLYVKGHQEFDHEDKGDVREVDGMHYSKVKIYDGRYNGNSWKCSRLHDKQKKMKVFNRVWHYK